MCKKWLSEADGRPWILGNMDLAIVKVADKKQAKVIIRMPQACESTVAITLQDQHGYEAGAAERQTGLTVLPVVTIFADVFATSRRDAMVRQTLGCNEIYRGEATIPISPSDLAATPVLKIEIAARFTPFGKLGGSAECCEKRITIDVSLRQMLSNRQEGWTTFWLMTRENASARLDEVAEKYGLYRRQGDDVSTTLVKLVRVIRSGLDSPVITERLVENKRGRRNV